MEKFSTLSVEELARLCSISDDIEAWEEFVRRFHRLIAKTVLRLSMRLGDPSRQNVDDLIQETYLKLCANNCRIISNFDHRSPEAFVGFVQAVAANVVRDYFKAKNAQRRGGNRIEGMSEDLIPPAPQGSMGSLVAIERSVLVHEVNRHLELCVSGPDRDRNIQIFWLYYRVGLSAAAISTLPGVKLTTKGVESLILRITKELRERMTASQMSRSGTMQDPSEGIVTAESF